MHTIPDGFLDDPCSFLSDCEDGDYGDENMERSSTTTTGSLGTYNFWTGNILQWKRVSVLSEWIFYQYKMALTYLEMSHTAMVPPTSDSSECPSDIVSCRSSMITPPLRRGDKRLVIVFKKTRSLIWLEMIKDVLLWVITNYQKCFVYRNVGVVCISATRKPVLDIKLRSYSNKINEKNLGLLNFSAVVWIVTARRCCPPQKIAM